MTISCSFCTKLTEGDYHSIRLHTMAIASCFILEKHMDQGLDLISSMN